MSRRGYRNRNRNIKLVGIFIFIVSISVIGFIFFITQISKPKPDAEEEKKIAQPEELLSLYMSLISEGHYEDMYAMLDEQMKEQIPEESFIQKNKNIYEGIEASNIAVEITGKTEEEDKVIVSYNTHMNSLAGEIDFSNTAYFTVSADKEYHLVWSAGLIFPNLGFDDRVRVNTLKSERGNITDRNGELLAGKGTASSVGLVPGKMSENREADIEKIAGLLDTTVESIQKKLSASYVKDDTFVPIRTISKDSVELEATLLEIKGIMISNTEVRSYPLGESISHLVGYTQNVSAEDLERHEGQGYNAGSIIGRTGLELLYEDSIRGIDGYEIVILDNENKTKQVLAKKHPRNGDNIQLTIDAGLQNTLYDQFREDKSASVAMNPLTGEILALVSTPTFNSNDFVLGMSSVKWDSLSNDANMPLYNRFKAVLCPGSGFKPIIAAIGLTAGIINPDDNYGYSGRSWQKDASWGGYLITTMKEYGDQVTLQNALIYSDNIYFAKAALNIGGELLAESLLGIGFDRAIPFEVGLYWSSFSNTNTFSGEIMIADSGYGQAQILINPIHMASMYSTFINDGNMIKPYLIYKGSPVPEYWIEQAFSKEAADIVRDDLIEVLRQGAGGLAKTDKVLLAGKTGTAEIKQSKEDKDGTELGWFNVFTADKSIEKPLLIITMVEDVKNRGGSGYVVPKVMDIFK